MQQFADQCWPSSASLRGIFAAPCRQRKGGLLRNASAQRESSDSRKFCTTTRVLRAERGTRKSRLAMLVVDPWHWLTKEGDLPIHHPRLYRRILRIARFIEYGRDPREERDAPKPCRMQAQAEGQIVLGPHVGREDGR